MLVRKASCQFLLRTHKNFAALSSLYLVYSLTYEVTLSVIASSACPFKPHLLNMHSTYLLLACLSTAYAFPNVTAIPSSGGCAAYPSYNPTTNTSGNFSVQLTNSENSTAEGLYGALIGFVMDSGSVSYTVSRAWKLRKARLLINCAPSLPQFGFPDPRSPKERMVLRCSNNTLESLFSVRAAVYEWRPWTFSDRSWKSLDFDRSDGLPVRVFNHYIDGVLQNGSYIGGFNSSTWVIWPSIIGPGPPFLHQKPRPYFGARLLGLDEPWTASSAFTDQFRAFLKIVPA